MEIDRGFSYSAGNGCHEAMALFEDPSRLCSGREMKIMINAFYGCLGVFWGP